MQRATETPWPRLAFSNLLAFSLAGAFLNLASATLRRAGGLVSVERILLALAGTALTLLLVHLAVGVVAGLARLVAGRRLRAVPLAVWSGLTVLSIGTLSPAWDLIREGLPIGGWTPAERLMTVSTVWSAAVLAPILGYRAAARLEGRPRAVRLGRGLLLAAPFLGAETFLFTWAEVHYASGIFSPISFLWLALYLASVAATVALATRWTERPRRTLPVLAAATAAVLLAPLPGLLRPVPSSAETPPEKVAEAAPRCVVLLSVDTLRADMIPPYGDLLAGGSPVPAPALAELAAASTVFVEARSPSPWTKPSAASILTGLSPGVTGTAALRASLPDRADTLAEHLGRAGYHTAAIGRNSFLCAAFNFQQGFDEFYFFPRGNGGILGAELLRLLLPERFSVEPGTVELTEFALSWLRRNHRRRFFLWLHYFDPHAAFAPPPEYLPAGPPPPRIGTAFRDPLTIRTGELAPDLEERAWIRELYRGEIRHVDRHVGRVLAALRELGLEDSCLLVFTSDHGEELWEHGGFEHGHTLYDELMRVPLSFRLPGGGGGGLVTTPVSAESVTPTILDLLGVEVPAGRFTSPSLAGVLRDGERVGGTPVFGGGVHYYEDEASVLFGNFKYVRELVTGREELYDLARDPLERRSIAGGSPELVRRARELLARRAEEEERLRRALRIVEEAPAELDSEELQDLRSLGYIN